MQTARYTISGLNKQHKKPMVTVLPAHPHVHPHLNEIYLPLPSQL